MSGKYLAVAIVLVLGSDLAQAQPIYAYRVATNQLVTFSAARPGTLTSNRNVTGLAAGETLAGIDFRPQNGQLYGLGVNPTAETATLYAISARTGVAAAVGIAGAIAFVDISANPVDFPDPAVQSYGFDFNPLADRVRVTAGALNFRINPNTGAGVDSDGLGANGINPDGAINGGTTTVNGTAYTNNHPNGSFTTLYTLDDSSDSIYIQVPPNNGTQTFAQSVTLNSLPLDFGSVNGFDIPSGVNTAASNAAVTSGFAYAALGVGGINSLYRIDLVGAQASLLGAIDTGVVPLQGLASQPNAPRALIGLNTSGTQLVRFNASTPAIATTATVGMLTPGETLVGIDFRPQTGQLMGLGVNSAADTATLYLLDPQTGAVTVVGVAGQIAFTDDGNTPTDLVDPATVGYGFDFNPTVDRIRVTSGSGLNFRVNPNTGTAVDGNLGGSAVIPGTNPDGAIQGSGSIGVVAAAYTNSFGQSLTGGVTTLYTLDAAQNALQIQNPANAGTQVEPLTVTLAGAPLDFTSVGGFDIAPEVVALESGTAASGEAHAVLTVGGVSALYAIDLATAQARPLGATAMALSALTVAEALTQVFADGFE